MLEKHPNIRRYRNSVRKDMHALPLCEIRRIVSLHHALANADVPVPRTLLDVSTRALCMPYLSGTTAYQFLAQNRFSASDKTRWSNFFKSDISPLLPLAQLHAVSVNHVSVSFSKPWKSIHNRVERINHADGQESGKVPVSFSTLQDCYAKLRNFEITSHSLQSDKRHLVHGDFHLKQVLIDQKKNSTWLIDLDDVCIGHIEQDIGNMLAHILTSEEFWRNSLEDHHGWLKELVVASLTERCDTELNNQRLAFYTAVSLLRRALKFVVDDRYLYQRSQLTDTYIGFIEALIQNPDNRSVKFEDVLLRHKRM